MFVRNHPKRTNLQLVLNSNYMGRFTSKHISIKSRYHEKNEDSCFVSDNLIIIADGMGGESCGDIASKIAVKSIRESLRTTANATLSDKTAQESMFTAITKADKDILDYINLHPDSVGMGTTILIALMIGDRMYISWCGDSRCFLFNNGHLISLTKDHSYIQELIDENKLTVEESFNHPDNNLITKYVGGGEDICKPEFTSRNIEEEDVYIFCSDGLSGYCKPDDIRSCIDSNMGCCSLPRQLLELAVTNGSDDDITIVTVENQKFFPLLRWLKHSLYR